MRTVEYITEPYDHQQRLDFQLNEKAAQGWRFHSLVDLNGYALAMVFERDVAPSWVTTLGRISARKED